MNINCPLCEGDGGDLVWSNHQLRVILANEPEFPGFCRVIWAKHITEMTDLAIEDRSLLMRTVMKVEQVIIDVMGPDKVNLAALGNMVPHLHWHVIPRYKEDSCFPASVWSEKQRESNLDHLKRQAAKIPLLKSKLQQVLDLN
jgi:diadenosine tetraphosphate (Ap4A) HIT family hydrolase